MNIEEISSIVKIDASKGDVIVITLSETDSHLPKSRYLSNACSIKKVFADAIQNEDVNVICIPFGTKVEVISAGSVEVVNT
jgi:hypothetical protein